MVMVVGSLRSYCRGGRSEGVDSRMMDTLQRAR